MWSFAWISRTVVLKRQCGPVPRNHLEACELKFSDGSSRAPDLVVMQTPVQEP